MLHCQFAGHNFFHASAAMPNQQIFSQNKVNKSRVKHFEEPKVSK